MTACACRGRDHVVCAPKWMPAPKRITLPVFRAITGRRGHADPVAWSMAEIGRLGTVPTTFTYRPPKAKPAAIGGLACDCRGKQHPVCLSPTQWKAWIKAVHKYLDRETIRPGDMEQTAPELIEEVA